MKSARKATHLGECQACGSTQKLPLGVLAQHGYEVKWHQFQGVCVGHGHLPYELSCELLPGLIEAAQIRRKRLEEAQAALRVPTTVNCVDYTFDRRDRRFAFDEAAHIETETWWTRGDPSGLVHFAVAERDGLREPVRSYLVTSGVTDALSLANAIRLRNADAIEPDIKAETIYIKWQQRRLADWRVCPLREVAEVEQIEKAKKQKARADEQAERDQKLRATILRKGERAAKLIAKYEKLVPADIRANLDQFTHPSLSAELKRRDIALPSTVRFLLSDMLTAQISADKFRYVADPWRQVEAASAAKGDS